MRWRGLTPVEEVQDVLAATLSSGIAPPPEVSRRGMTIRRARAVKARTPGILALTTTPHRKAGWTGCG
ncbi:hypothetical protein [Streptomyces sp. TLI_185]|uniref:hypothetical protein n=1 Tax=Streptomyces sp. TLI_185 TaxID=2485151 RepID=UPI000F50A132|nr:hypothetical protein [Streptomyces sp. TLI_185]RPF37778.1 hypothetical protein EDD92_7868 [Streptomyces sp. TLI_185]